MWVQWGPAAIREGLHARSFINLVVVLNSFLSSTSTSCLPFLLSSHGLENISFYYFIILFLLLLHHSFLFCLDGPCPAPRHSLSLSVVCVCSDSGNVTLDDIDFVYMILDKFLTFFFGIRFWWNFYPTFFLHFFFSPFSYSVFVFAGYRENII